MEEIYKLCDRIIDNKVLTIEALEMVLRGISKGSRLRYKTNTDTFRTRAQAMNHRAKKYGVRGKVSPKELKELFETKKRCAICGSTDDLVFDHIVPIYKKGDNTLENLQILCAKCNMEKGIQ